MNNRSDIPLITVLACIGLLLFFVRLGVEAVNSDIPLPEQNTPMLTIAEAEHKAAQFFKNDLNLSPDHVFGYFYSLEETSLYLQKEKLYLEYDQYFANALPLDYYVVEISEQTSGDVYKISIHPYSGKVFAWSPLLLDMNAVSESLSDHAMKEQQRAVESMLINLGYHLDILQLTSTPNEVGDSFVYRFNRDALDELSIDIWITVKGGHITAIEPHYDVPNSLLNWKSFHDQWSDRLGLAGWGIMLLAGFSAFLTSIFIRKRTQFSRGIILSILFFIIYTLLTINMYPAFYTDLAAGGYFGVEAHSMNMFMILIQIGLLLLLAISIYFNLTAGDALWQRERRLFLLKEHKQERLAGQQDYWPVRGGGPLWPSWRDEHYGQHLLAAMGRGYLFCFIILGIQSIIFMVSETQFDLLATNKPSSSIFNVMMPVLFPLLAWVAAISEEAIFRMFGIIALKKLLRSTMVAVILSSFLWALGHAGYLYPFYARLIEVTILGVIFSIIFLRYGFMTAVFAHAIMDSFLMGIYLMSYGLSTGQTLDAIAGLLHIAAPAVVAVILLGLYHLFRRKQSPPHPEAS